MPGAIVGSAVPAAAPAPDLGAMLAGANLKSMLMTGGGDAAGDAAGAAGAVSLADLEQRMSGAAVSTAPAAPGPDDPAAFWTMLAGGAPAAPRFGGAAAPKPPAQVTMPPAAASKASKASKAVPKPKGGGGPAAAAPVSLDQIEAAAGVTPVTTAPAPATSISLEELEATTASSAPSGGDEDPLAFWAELQAQHRAEADRLTGTVEKKNRRARGKKD